MQVGGLPLSELNQLELQFLYLNDFRLRITNDELQFYTNALAKQTQIPPDVSIAPYLPQSPAFLDPNERPPIGPRSFLAAIESLLAQGDPDVTEHSMSSHRSRTPSPVRPMEEFRRSASSFSVSSNSASIASDAASETGTETDVDGSTDDEPTIRAPHSSSSDATSVHSVASDADSIYTDDGDRSRDSYDGSSRDYRMMSP